MRYAEGRVRQRGAGVKGANRWHQCACGTSVQERIENGVMHRWRCIEDA